MTTPQKLGSPSKKSHTNEDSPIKSKMTESMVMIENFEKTLEKTLEKVLKDSNHNSPKKSNCEFCGKSFPESKILMNLYIFI